MSTPVIEIGEEPKLPEGYVFHPDPDPVRADYEERLFQWKVRRVVILTLVEAGLVNQE